MPPNWKGLPKYQQIKYIAELIAICGGLLLLLLNAYQLKLLAQSNAINMEMFRSTFPLEIESSVIEYTDKQPIVLKIKLTNVVNQRLYIHTWPPKIVLSNSNEIRNGMQEVKANFCTQENNTKLISSPYDDVQKVVLKPAESCVMEMPLNLSVATDHPEQATFIILPMTLIGLEQQSARTLLVSLSRDRSKSLIITSDMLRVSDDDTLLQIIRLERSRFSMPKWD